MDAPRTETEISSPVESPRASRTDGASSTSAGAIQAEITAGRRKKRPPAPSGPPEFVPPAWAGRGAREIFVTRGPNQGVIVYQAYNDTIADTALRDGKFGAAFKFDRMTWIKPSMLWMMYRSGFGTKDDNQSRVLAIEVSGDFFRSILSQASETGHGAPRPEIRPRGQLALVQWDPERAPTREGLVKVDDEMRSIQIGVPPELVPAYNDNILSITDVTPTAHALHAHLKAGDWAGFGRLLPHEARYEVSAEIAARLKMTASP